MRRRLFRRSDTGAGARLIQGTRGIASLSRARMQVRVNKVLVGESGGDEQAAQLAAAAEEAKRAAAVAVDDFFGALEAMDEEMRRKVLHFATGLRRLPPGAVCGAAVGHLWPVRGGRGVQGSARRAARLSAVGIK